MKKIALVVLALLMLIAVPCLFPMQVLAQPSTIGPQGQPTTAAPLPKPTATVALDPMSKCSGGFLNISVTTPTTMTYLYGIATTSTGTVLQQFKETGNWGTSFTGGIGYGGFSPSVPPGTIVTLFGYMGKTPPSAGNTAEFSVSYRCDTGTVLQTCAGPYGFCIKQPNFPGLDGVWFKLNAVVNGNYVANGNGVTGDITPHNFSVPFYMGFAWNATNVNYDVRIFTETAPGVWTNTYTTTRPVIPFTQNILNSFCFEVYVNNATDYFMTCHTAYIKYMVDKTGVLKSATYSGTGDVPTGWFNAGASYYAGSNKISGSTVSVSHLPFIP